MNWLILSFIFISTSLFAGEGFLCLEKGQSVNQAYIYLADFFLAKDRAYANTEINCIQVSSDETRQEMLTNILAKKFKLTSFKNSNRHNTLIENIEHCQMQITQITNTSGTGKSGNFGSKSSAQAFESSGESRSVSSLMGLSGEPVQFTAYGESVNIVCVVLPNSRFGIRVSLNSQAANGALATTVNINKGEVMNLGELVKEAQNKTKSLDINQGVGAGVTNDKLQTRYELVIP